VGRSHIVEGLAGGRSWPQLVSPTFRLAQRLTYKNEHGDGKENNASDALNVWMPPHRCPRSGFRIREDKFLKAT
jgi:hypothetical protein